MPPKAKISREKILSAAVDVVRERGAEKLTAKAVAAKLKCSTQPVFWYYENMEALKRDVFGEAMARFSFRLRAPRPDCASPYMGVGLNYIAFATEEKELFKLLFMSGIGGRDMLSSNVEREYILELMERSDSVTGAKAENIYREMWLFSHGIAAMTVTDTARFTDEEIRNMLSRVYRGLLTRDNM